jgi:parvulin-like peptidyl-prolyl isomerase
MFSCNSKKSLIFIINIFCLFAWIAQAGAHAGHSHAADDPNIKVPAVVARVNGKDISNQYILGKLKQYIRHQKSGGHKVTPDQEKAEVKRLIDDEIGRELLLQHADSLGIKATSELLNKKIYIIRSDFKSDHQFETALKRRKITLEELKDELKPEVLVDAVVEREIVPHVKLNAEETKGFYEKNKRMFWEEDKMRASVILIKIDISQGPQAEEKAKMELEKVLEEVRKGADFAGAAKKHSQDSLGNKGGDLGFFTRKKMLPAFSDKAFSMEVGEVSSVFKTRHGLHILKATDKKPGGYAPFDAVKKDIEKKIKKQKLKTQTKEYVHQLRKKADVKVYF